MLRQGSSICLTWARRRYAFCKPSEGLAFISLPRDCFGALCLRAVTRNGKPRALGNSAGDRRAQQPQAERPGCSWGSAVLPPCRSSGNDLTAQGCCGGLKELMCKMQASMGSKYSAVAFMLLFQALSGTAGNPGGSVVGSLA